MLYDGLRLIEGSKIENASLPVLTQIEIDNWDTNNPNRLFNIGELVFNSTTSSLQVFDGMSMVDVGTGGVVAAHMADTALHLSPQQNTLLDNLSQTLTAEELNYVEGVNSPIQTQLNALVSVNDTQTTYINDLQTQINDNQNAATASLNSHIANDALHLTVAQNTLLDEIDLPTITATNINNLSGLTLNVQNTLNSLTSSVSDRLPLAGGTMTGNITFSDDAKVTGLPAPSNGSDAVNKIYVDNANNALQLQITTLDSNKLNRAGGTLHGSLSMGGNALTNLPEPQALTDAATKGYVDNAVSGVSWKAAVRVATTANIALSGLQVIDGVTLVANDRVLVKNQTVGSNNGIYLAGASAWTRAPDADTEAEMHSAAVFVREGTTNADTAWVSTVDVAGFTLDPEFRQFGAAASGAVAGAGISISGPTISARVGDGMTFVSNDLSVHVTTDFTFVPDPPSPTNKLRLADTGVAAGSYGSSTQIPVIQVDSKGRITTASTVNLPPLSDILQSITGLSANGLIVRTSSVTTAARSLAVSGGGLTVSNADGVGGNPTITISSSTIAAASTIALRDSSGNLTANQFNGNLNGNAPWANITGKPTTLSGYGITDGVSSTTDGVMIYRPPEINSNSVNFNTVLTSGTYRVGGNGSWSGSSNAPTGAYPYGALNVYRDNFNVATQEYFPHNAAGSQRAWRSKFNASDWGAWVYELNSATFNSYAPTLTGTGASGTWGINITGNAGNASSISNAVGGSYTWTGSQYFRSNNNTASANNVPLQAYSDNASGAIMNFHRIGQYAVNMGLDSDNVFRIGGWSAPANRLQMDMNGNLTMAGDVTAFSDIRRKKDINTIGGALDKVNAMRGVMFTRIEDDKRGTGVIAQEMREVMPEVVLEDAEGTLSVAYGNLAGVLIEAIKELSAKVKELEAKLATKE
jgi:hypothetical protein